MRIGAHDNRSQIAMLHQRGNSPAEAIDYEQFRDVPYDGRMRVPGPPSGCWTASHVVFSPFPVTVGIPGSVRQYAVCFCFPKYVKYIQVYFPDWPAGDVRKMARTR